MNLRPAPARMARWVACVLAGAVVAWAEEAALRPGDRIPSLTVGKATYTDIRIRTVNARTITITHAGGMCSIHLHDLSPEWQARFRYDPTKEAEADRALSAAIATAPKPVKTVRPAGRVDAVVRQFGQPVTLFPEIDLRPKYAQLDLGVKNQGRRPSCAVFAIVSALELQNADATGVPEKFSEEYLIWATQKLLHPIASAPRSDQTDPGNVATPALDDDADTGYTLADVVSALRAYGVPPRSALPNRTLRPERGLEDPAPEIVAAARTLRPVRVFAITGPDNAAMIANIARALNEGIPVVGGLGWPTFRSLHGGVLATQRPMPGTGHAVTFVGYQAPNIRIDDAVFIFKNSWGTEWGQNGFGTVTYQYLLRNLADAVVLEVDARGGR